MTGEPATQRPTVAAMRAHLDELAVEMGPAWLHEGWEGTAETKARLSWCRGSGPGGINNVVVRIPQLRDRRAYFAGLHEFGHLHALRTGQMRSASGVDRRDDPRLLIDEAYAWAWAFENARWTPTWQIAEHAQRALLGYIIDLGFGLDPDGGAEATGEPETYREFRAAIDAARDAAAERQWGSRS